MRAPGLPRADAGQGAAAPPRAVVPVLLYSRPDSARRRSPLTASHGQSWHEHRSALPPLIRLYPCPSVPS